MPNTSSDSSTKELDLPEVEVLLATFNGALYLSEFLDSLLNQRGVRIHLRVSDDGSTDETLVIVNSFKNKFESCQIYSGPQQGPSANFFSLIEKATYNFVALADQDDFWHPNHLLSSIKRLAFTQDIPSMTFSAVIEFGENLKSETIWPNRFPGEDIRTILTENLARGCTFLLNSKAIDLIKQLRPNHAIMHDWWILMLIFSSGNVTWSKQPEVNYRIHLDNSIGGTPGFEVRLKRFMENIKLGKWKILNQANELLNNHKCSMTNEHRNEINKFVSRMSSRKFIDKLRLVLWGGRYRSAIIDELAVRLAFLIRVYAKK
jgi:glycosyltransferase involved in cell wall biosynthesis